LYIFFWVFPRRQIVVGRLFGTCSSSIFKGWVYIVHPNFEDGTATGSEKSANYNLTPGKYPKENIQYSNHGESLKSRRSIFIGFEIFRPLVRYFLSWHHLSSVVLVKYTSAYFRAALNMKALDSIWSTGKHVKNYTL